jgi:protein TonB
MEFQRIYGRSSRRSGIALAVLGVHGIVIALFARSSVLPSEPGEVAPLTVSIVQPVHTPHSPAPQLAPRLAQIHTEVVAPEVVVQLPPSPTAITAVAAPPGPPAAYSAGPTIISGPLLISEVAYLRMPQPRYPTESRQAREEGLVVLRVLIDTTGHAQQVTVVQSSGHPRLDAAAREAVAHALFKPYFADGVAHDALATVPVEFSLHRV